MSSKSVLSKSNKFLTEDEDLSYLTFVNHKKSKLQKIILHEDRKGYFVQSAK